ncbi:MAG: hypothetical protein CL912_04695 [Deltaproteobacteria bacterium]|nr:hypothetical protein [Deltaproteobacteria bacterium]
MVYAVTPFSRRQSLKSRTFHVNAVVASKKIPRWKSFLPGNHNQITMQDRRTEKDKLKSRWKNV